MQDYSDKSGAYFQHARKEVAPLLPALPQRVLELGCGAGATLAWLKQQFAGVATVGIEIDPQAADQARRHVDRVLCLDFENHDSPEDLGVFDVILCLDVLEHLVDPWAMVERLVAKHMQPGGTLIVSLPNVRHYSVLLPLLFLGRWDYADTGLLDRTHLRFFTRSSAMRLAAGDSRQVIAVHATGVERGRKTWWFDRMTFALFRPFFEYQYLIQVRKELG
jgi:2-polyprenyl-3-methyl-5-hydroxy-6-metoxy-1,4-benzoquinol methylase